jgi:hypothetical protein
MRVANVLAPATECSCAQGEADTAHSHPPVARAVIPVGFCFALRERACADPQTLRSEVVRGERERGHRWEARSHLGAAVFSRSATASARHVSSS